MSTNHTPNFNLCQWEATDQVLRSDFNQDNAKLDAALACHPSAELICSAEIMDENTNQIKLDISQVDWNRYFMLFLSMHKNTRNAVTITTDRGNGHSIRLYNGGENNNNYMSYFYEAMEVRALLFVGYNGDATPVLFGTSTCAATGNFHEYFSVTAGFIPVPYKELSELRIGVGNSNVGAKVELWGVK